jgi:hypothetical protein
MIGLHEVWITRACGHHDHINTESKEIFESYRKQKCFNCWTLEKCPKCKHLREDHGASLVGPCNHCACERFFEPSEAPNA